MEALLREPYTPDSAFDIFLKVLCGSYRDHSNEIFDTYFLPTYALILASVIVVAYV